MTNHIVKKEEFRWSFRKKGTQVFNICKHLFLVYGFAAALMMGTPNKALANPAGGTVVGGAATITTSGTTETINQTSQNAEIKWGSFNIAKGETTQINQPGANSSEIEEITTSGQLTAINGDLSSNGRVIIINPNGVIIGNGGSVDTSGFIATTAGLANGSFNSSTTLNTLNFNKAGKANAKVVNKGTITVADEGLVALVAPSVRNDGLIQGTGATIQLGAADTFGVDLYGDGLINLAVGQSTKLKAENNGEIITPGGKVLMTAAAASDVVDSVINNKGVIEATSLVNQNGEIVLTGAGANVKVSGTLDVSGANGGGSIKVGGDSQGGGTLAHAATVKIAPTAVLNASATDNGNGGNIVVWSDNATSFQGTALAEGGANGGNGGNVETSSANYLNAAGTVNASAANGAAGTWLLDPKSIEITSATNSNITGTTTFKTTGTGSATSDLSVATLNSALNTNGGTNVTITTVGGTGSGTGDITAEAGADILKNASGHDAFLTLDATGSITLNNTITSTANKLNLVFNAGNDLNINNTITTNGGGINAKATNAISVDGVVNTGGGYVTLDSSADSVSSGSSDTVTTSGGNVAISAAGAVTLNGAISAGTASITITGATGGGPGDVTTGALTTSSNGPGTYAGPITVSTTDGTVTLDGPVTSAGNGSNITVSASGALTALGAIATDTNGTVTLSSTNSTVSTQAITAASGNVTVNAPGAITVDGDINTGAGAVTIASNNSSITDAANAITTNGGEVAVSAATFITLGGDVSSGAGEIRITGAHHGAGNVEVAGVTSTSGNITVGTPDGAVTLNDAVTSTSGNIDVSASGALLASGAIGTGSNKFVTLTSTGSTVSAQAITTAGGNVTVTADGGAVTTGDIATTSGGIALTSGNSGSIQTGNLSIASTNGYAGALTVNSAGALTTGTVSVSSTSATGVSGDSVSLTSNGAMNTGAVLVVNDATGGDTDATASLTSNSGSITTGPLTVTSTSGSFPSGGSTLTVNSAGALTVNGAVLVTNFDGGDPAFYSESAATLSAQNNVNITGGITVSSQDTDPPNAGSTASLSVTSAAGAVNIGGAVGVSSDEGQEGSGGSQLTASTTLTVSALDDITIGGSISGTTTSTSGATPTASTLVSIISTNGDLWLSGAAPQSVANTASESDVYTGLAFNQTNTTNANNNVAQLILSGANAWYTLTYTANTTSTTYGTAATGLTGTVSGVAPNETGTLAFSTPATALSNVGQYAIDGSGLSAPNYTFVQAAGNATALTINPATLTVALEGSVEKTYDGTTTATLTSGNYQLENIVGAGNVSLNDPATGTYDTANAGTGKTVTVGGLALTGTGAGNYTLNGVTTASGAVGIIDAENITVSTNNVVKTYDGTTSTAGATTAPALTVTSGTLYTNQSNGNTQDTLSGGTFAYTDPNAGIGNKTVTVSGVTANDGNSGGNYNISYQSNTTSTINQEAITVSTANVTKTYDGTTSTADATTGPVLEVTSGTLYANAVLGGGSFAYTDPNVGSGNKTVAVTGTVTAVDNNGSNNYAITLANNTTSTIDPARLTVTADNKSMTYGGSTLPTLTDTITGYVDNQNATSAGQTGSAVLSTTATAYNGTAGSGSNAGAYAITAAPGSLNAANYTFSYVAGVLTVNKAPLTITADNQTITVGQTVPSDTVSYSSFANGDTPASLTKLPTVASAENGTPSPGNYVGNYTPGGAVDGNYTFSYVSGNLTVNPFTFFNTLIGPLGRPIISVADDVLNYYPPFEPIQTHTLDVNVSLRGDGNGTGNPLSNIEPAAGDDDDRKKKHKKGPNDLANIEPAAGGNGGGAGTKPSFACADDFLDGKSCAAQ